MKRMTRKQIAIVLIASVLAGMLSGCSGASDNKPPVDDIHKEDETDKEKMETIEIGYVNEISTADVWIIPDIEENHKTSLWGTAALKGAEPEKEYSADIVKSSDDRYLLRMIDVDELYYESGSFTLLEGYSLLIYGTDDFSEPHIVIYDDRNEIVEDFGIFCAAL